MSRPARVSDPAVLSAVQDRPIVGEALGKFSSFREPEEIVCYSDFEELVTQVDRWLPDDAARTSIATRARDVVRRRDSRDARIGEILERHRTLQSDDGS